MLGTAKSTMESPSALVTHSFDCLIFEKKLELVVSPSVGMTPAYSICHLKKSTCMLRFIVEFCRESVAEIFSQESTKISFKVKEQLLALLHHGIKGNIQSPNLIISLSNI